MVETFQGKATTFTRSLGLANLGIDAGPAEAGTAHAAQLSAVSSEPEDGQAGQQDAAIDVWRSISFATANAVYPALMSSGGNMGCGNSPASTTSWIPASPPVRPRKRAAGHGEDAARALWPARLRRIEGHYRRAGQCRMARRSTTASGIRSERSIDNIEDVDTAVGYLAEYRRPHGFAISETQFVVFILNASRRLFSDRFFTSCFRPEFYTTLGIDWVNHNGPGPEHDGTGRPKRTYTASITAEADADAEHPRAFGPNSTVW